jgi:hypothetical protein
VAGVAVHTYSLGESGELHFDFGAGFSMMSRLAARTRALRYCVPEMATAMLFMDFVQGVQECVGLLIKIVRFWFVIICKVWEVYF